MKSLNKFINESKSKCTVDFDDNSDFYYLTPGYLEGAGEACVIIGKPCGKKDQADWKEAYDLAKKIGLNVSDSYYSEVYSDIKKQFKYFEDDMGEEFDDDSKLCIVLHDMGITVYTYQDGGVYPIK